MPTHKNYRYSYFALTSCNRHTLWPKARNESTQRLEVYESGRSAEGQELVYATAGGL
jgi:hypothetical protein